MIGIDIVDLERASLENNWRRAGYLHKIFSVPEQKEINSTDAPDILVWLLWSMKEAAYKIFSRELLLRNFAPTRIMCFLNADSLNLGAKLRNNDVLTFFGKTIYEDQIYITRSLIDSNQGFVQTLAAAERSMLEKSVTEIRQNNEYLYRHRGPDSVSHHGRFLALAFLASNQRHI